MSTCRGIDHFGITVPDLEAATRFLVEAFDAKPLYDNIRRTDPPFEGAIGAGLVGMAADAWAMQIDYLLATTTGEYLIDGLRWLGWVPLAAAYLWLREQIAARPRATRPHAPVHR